MSSIGWVAFSEKERRRTLDVLSLFSESGAVDEIGVGRIRDSFSDLLFPGTSTIQTRARYFLIVPWLYRRIEMRSSVDDAQHEVWKLETRFIRGLEGAGADADKHGMFGGTAGAEIHRLPSEIYWQGLLRWGIRKRVGPRSLCHREMSALKFRGRSFADPEDDAQAARSWWDHGLIPEPDDFWEKPTLALTEVEAHYLRDAINVSTSGTLISFLVDSANELPQVDRPWDLPSSYLVSLTPAVEDALSKARAFSLVMNGASILFNLMLAEMRSDQPEWLESYEGRNQEWIAEVESGWPILMAELGSGEALDGFWSVVRAVNPRVPGPQEKSFVERWIRFVLTDPESVVRNPDARRLIVNRERMLKGKNRAKLSSASALQYWRGGNGSPALDFRWSTVRQHLADIRSGLRSGAKSEV